MKFKVRLRLFTWMAVLVFTAIISFILKDILASYFFSPLIIFSQIGIAVFQTIPRLFWWGLMIVLMFFLTIKFFPFIKAHKTENPPIQEKSHSRMLSWIKWIERSDDGDYADWFLSSQIADLVIESIAYRNRQTPEQINHAIKDREIVLPEEIEEYILAGLRPPNLQGRHGLLARFRKHKKGSFAHTPLNLVIDFLEAKIGTGE